ncbi:MAG: hypothetical protein Q9172_006330 [Xanthocarpia lactea]
MTPKPLDVAGRCKPMRVEKPKRARTHKVKQGTPPKLSASQKRKLVRLYVLTNLSWKAIESLVSHFGRKDIKKRALQYILQNLLSAQYNHMRPKDAPARRKRTTQFQNSKDLERARKNEHQAFGRILHPANACLPPATQGDVDDPDKPDISTTLGPLTPPEMAEADLSYLNEFDKMIEIEMDKDTIWHSLIGDSRLFRDTSMTTSASPHFNLDVDMSIPPISESDAPISYTDAIGSGIGLESSRRYDLLQPHAPSSLGARFGNHLTARDEAFESPNNQPTPLKEYDDLQMTRFAYPKAGHPIQLTTKQCAIESDTRDLLPSKSQDQGLTSDLSHRRSNLPHHTQGLHASRIGPLPEVSVLVDGLSECSSGGKRFIKDALSGFSVSTTLSSIHGSDGSISSFRPAESVTDRMVRIVKPAGSRSKRRAVSPGDFITSNINTFRKHIYCEIPKAARCESWTFCSSCFQGIIGNSAREIWCIPFAVIQFKRGMPVDKIWFTKDSPWFIDRFGNTSLHMAAALGATFEELRDIINKGLSIDATNSGSQTFMHLLNPFRGAAHNLFTLTDYLNLKGFRFHHRDMLGHTFIDSLELRSMRSPERCPLWDFNSLRSWFFDGERTCVELSYTVLVEKHSYKDSTTTRELLNTPKALFNRFKYLVDHRGRNSLHVAVDNKPRPPGVSEQSFNDACLSLVGDLVSIGVDVNDRDNSGETPLMTHIRTLPSNGDIIGILLKLGADINLRNEQGEAALHISIKLGSIIGTQALLEQGANINIHVRNWKGEGLLAVGARAQRKAKLDVTLYARITTCMALAMDFGAIASPSLFDEWDMPMLNGILDQWNYLGAGLPYI